MKKVIMVFVLFSLGTGSLFYCIKKPAVFSEPGRIILITGSCSSGKSSLARNIAQELNAPYFAFDEMVMPQILKKMVNQQIGGFLGFFLNKLVVRNFFTFVGLLSDKTKYKFQKKFYAALQDGIGYQPTVNMYKRARACALAGDDVVVEVPLHLGEGIDCLGSLETFKDLKVMRVLAYCPWQCLVERINLRNRTMKKKHHRELDWALGNFVHYFDISTEENRRTIDYVVGINVKDVLKSYRQAVYKKKRLYILDETEKATLKCFNSDGMNYISPKLSYDVIINTKIYGPEKGAAYVLDCISRMCSRSKIKEG